MACYGHVSKSMRHLMVVSSHGRRGAAGVEEGDREYVAVCMSCEL